MHIVIALVVIGILLLGMMSVPGVSSSRPPGPPTLPPRQEIDSDEIIC